MRSKALVSLVAAALLLLLAASSEANVLRVVVVETPDVGKYVAEVGKGQAIMKRVGASAQIRIWRARFAGSDAGSVVISIEYPDLAAFANDDKKLGSDAEFQAWLKGLDKVRKIVSDSLYDELKP